MAHSQMTRVLVKLEADFTSVDINNSYATHSKSNNKSQIPDTAKENNLLPKEAINKTCGDEAATPFNLHSPLRESSELITLSNTGQSSTRMQCYFHCLQSCFTEYFDDFFSGCCSYLHR